MRVQAYKHIHTEMVGMKKMEREKVRDHQQPCQALIKLHIKVSLKTILELVTGWGDLEVKCSARPRVSRAHVICWNKQHTFIQQTTRDSVTNKKRLPSFFCSATTTRGNYLESVACVVIQQNTALDVRAFKCPGFWAPVCCGMIRNQVGGKGQQR